MNAKKSLGRGIKKVRQTKGLTQDQLAELCDIGPKYLSGIERGVENPTLKTILKIADSLKVNPETIFKDDERISPARKKERITALLNEANSAQLSLIYEISKAVMLY